LIVPVVAVLGAGVALTAGQREVEPPALSIALDGGGSAKWRLADLWRVPANLRVSTARGEMPAWSLRDVAHVLAGEHARVGALTSARGETLILPAADWDDPSRLPILRINRRGLWKFEWLEASTKAPGAGLKDVTGMSLAVDR
jgi:hypothetical protein